MISEENGKSEQRVLPSVLRSLEQQLLVLGTVLQKFQCKDAHLKWLK